VSNYLILCQIVYNPLTQCQTLLVKLFWSNYLIQYRTFLSNSIVKLGGFCQADLRDQDEHDKSGYIPCRSSALLHLQLQSLKILSRHAAILYATHYAVYCMKPYKMNVPNCSLVSIIYIVCYNYFPLDNTAPETLFCICYNKYSTLPHAILASQLCPSAIFLIVHLPRYFNWRAQNHSELTHHTNDITLQHVHYNGFGYIQSTAPKFMMWLLGELYKLLQWPCMQMGMVQVVHWGPGCSTISQPQ